MVDFRWLTSDEQELWRAFLEASTRLMDSLDRELVAATGLTLADYEILVRLSEMPDRCMPMSHLAAQTLIAPSRLTYRVDRLGERGWVTRCADEADRRVIRAELTEAGMALLTDAAPDHVDAVRRRFIEPMQSVFRASGDALTDAFSSIAQLSEKSAPDG